MSRRKTKPGRLRRDLGDRKIRFAETIRCRSGHEFWLDTEKLREVVGYLPPTIACPYPKCETPRAPIPTKEKGTNG